MGHDPGLIQHDDRRLVDLVEELDNAYKTRAA